MPDERVEIKDLNTCAQVYACAIVQKAMANHDGRDSYLRWVFSGGDSIFITSRLLKKVGSPKKITDHYKNLGIREKNRVGGRGVIGFLQGGKPDPAVALRADFDEINHY